MRTPFYYVQEADRNGMITGPITLNDRRETTPIGIVYDPVLAERIIKLLNSELNYVTGEPPVYQPRS